MSENKRACRPTSIGGQAVIEGVMMKGPDSMAIAIRKSPDNILVYREPVRDITKRYPLFKLPVLRGMFTLIDTMVLGVRALTFSAEQVDFLEDEGPSRFDRMMEKIFGDKADNVTIYFSVFLSFVLALLLFILLPTYLMKFSRMSISNPVVLNLVEGFIRITIFLIYLLLVSRMKDIQRVFEYHGAEHKTIHCYEHGEELTVENAEKYSTLHPRCGTSFLLIVMVVSILIFSFVGWPNILVRILSRILLFPVVAGVSYEIIKWAGRSEGTLARIIRIPGMWLQKLTTREPDRKQLEVAIKSLQEVLSAREEADAR